MWPYTPKDETVYEICVLDLICELWWAIRRMDQNLWWWASLTWAQVIKIISAFVKLVIFLSSLTPFPRPYNVMHAQCWVEKVFLNNRTTAGLVSFHSAGYRLRRIGECIFSHITQWLCASPKLHYKYLLCWWKLSEVLKKYWLLSEFIAHNGYNS